MGGALAGGAPRRLSARGGLGKISPDASKVLVVELETGADGLIHPVYKVMNVGDGTIIARVVLPGQPDGIEWSPDGQALLFVDHGQPVWNVWRAPVSGGAPRQVTPFKEGRVTSFEFSPDGRRLAVARTVADTTNVWILEADGSNPVQATRFQLDDIFDLHWMTDGTRLVVNAGKRSRDAVLIRNFR